MQHMMCAIGRLLDYLVGALREEPRHVDTERLGGLEVDHQLEPGRLLHRQIGWLGALQYLVNERRSSRNRAEISAP